MLSITTNLQSQIAQNSLKTSTNKLNQAIERMSTGFKINHASDNAANYSISTNMTTKLGAYQIAEDNVASGMDLVATASDTIALMQDKAARLSALSTQARNGTYGAQSLNAINSEANAIATEIARLYSTAEYNGVKLFQISGAALPSGGAPRAGAARSVDGSADMPSKQYGDFIADPKTYTDAEVAVMTRVADATTFTSGQKYSISTVEELQKLATEVNSGVDTTGVEFVLGDDIDLSSIANWTPIGINYSNQFKGTFDGNGHVIRNLKINSTAGYQGLFGCAGGSSQLKNIGLENVDVKGGSYVGGLAGCSIGIINSYATGVIKGTGDYVGGLAGSCTNITNSYATGDITGTYGVGGLAGSCTNITNSYATGDVTGTEYRTGGLVGAGSYISYSYATGNVTGEKQVGGLVGCFSASSDSAIANSYATGNVTGNSDVGGLAGYVCCAYHPVAIDKSASYGTVSGTNLDSTGSFIGMVDITRNGTTFGTLNITNSTALAQGMNKIGSCSKSGWIILHDYDMTAMLAGIEEFIPSKILQVGINGTESSQIEFTTAFFYDFANLLSSGIESESAYNQINDLMNRLSEKATELGAVENRLESALESISVNIENLASSRSTLRDADMSEVSSEYIRQQILQEASATLMATANQSPALALQLL